tara:strand:- start:655 stop:906 length:252 start_codon:yes stop_codon:yes gene_type:complete
MNNKINEKLKVERAEIVDMNKAQLERRCENRLRQLLTSNKFLKETMEQKENLLARVFKLEDQIKSMYNLAMQISEEVQKCKIK